MIRLERTLQISVYLTAALSSLMLGMGEHVWVYVAVLWMAAAAAYFYTDRWQRLVLPRPVANVLALAAGVLALYEIVLGGMEYQLIGVAHFLVYLQIVIFFQRKGPREYAQIAVLSLFQVMVAAVVSLNVNFALFLVAELLLSLWVLLLVQLNRQWHLHGATSEATAAPAFSAVGPQAGPSAAIAKTSQLFSASATGADREFPASHLVRLVLALGGIALVIAVLVFPITPRVKKVQWVGSSGVATTGLSPEVQLGEIARVLESNEEVMTVALRRQGTDQSYKAPGELLLRGYVLTRYSNGRWERHPIAASQRLPGAASRNSIRQEIELQKNNLGVLFAMLPIETALFGPREEALSRDRETGALVPLDGFDTKRIRYTVYSPANRLLTDYASDLAPPDRSTLASLSRPPDALPRLSEFAKERAGGIVPEPDRAGPSQLRVARDFEAYLLDANRFTYSLDAVLPERSAVRTDPVEEFLLNHRTGYCEYFASALTLMLRAVAIPARMVAGYKGGEYNGVGDYYTILDKDAHNWVEAYVADADGKQGWVVLDPTPIPPELQDFEVAGSWYSTLHAWMSYYQRLWSRYVVDLDNSSQQRFIRDAGNEVFGALARWRDRFDSPGTFGGLYSRAMSRGFWGGVSIVVLGLMALGACGLLGWMMLRAASALARRFRGQGRSAENGQRVEVEFYRRLIEVLQESDLVRSPSSTHREFAGLARRRLAAQPHTRDVAEVPERIVDWFHRVRFGHEPMAPERETELTAAIAQLRTCLERGNGASAATTS